MSPSRAGRKLRAVAGVLAVVAAACFGLRRLMTPQRDHRAAAPRPPLADPEAGARRSSRAVPRASLRPGEGSPRPLAWPSEPPYDLLAKVDPVLAAPVWGLFSASTWTQKTAALELSSHFVASDTLTGLCAQAPDTLWVVAEAIHRKRGMPAALEQLYRALPRVANLEDYEKDDFVDQLQDPMAIYVPLSISHAPHVRESRRMFGQFRRLLAPRNLLVTEWIRANDPELRFAPGFLLRLNAYEALVPYLRERPGEARAIVPMIFPEQRADAVDLTADQIQNIFDSLAGEPGGKEALVELAEGCLTQLAMASGPVRDKITLFLQLNWKRLPSEAREAAEFVIGQPREPAANEPAPAAVPPPYKRWPKTEWRFTQHFSDEKDFKEWERYFVAKSYRREGAAEDSIVMARQIPSGPRIVLTGYLYASLETGMLFGPGLRRFQRALARDVHDPAVQGVFIRAHAQFPRTPAFTGAKPGPKVWYDGSCRGAWDLNRLSSLCPECALVGNVGSGRSFVNNPMIWALLEGLGRREGWDALAKRIQGAVPEHHTRLIGPWTTQFSHELKTLGKRKTKRK